MAGMGLTLKITRFALLFAILLAIWLGLSGKFDAFHVAWGVAGAAVAAALATPRQAGPAFPLVRFLLFVPWQLWQIFISNLRVAKLVLWPGLAIEPRLLKRRPGLTDDRALTLLGCSITLTPGTLTVDIHTDEMVVHALDKPSADDVNADVMLHKISHVFGEHTKS